MDLVPVVQKVENAIHRVNHYPLDSAIVFAMTYSLDSAFIQRKPAKLAEIDILPACTRGLGPVSGGDYG